MSTKIFNTESYQRGYACRSDGHCAGLQSPVCNWSVGVCNGECRSWMCQKDGDCASRQCVAGWCVVAPIGCGGYCKGDCGSFSCEPGLVCTATSPQYSLCLPF